MWRRASAAALVEQDYAICLRVKETSVTGIAASTGPAML
jgi:hypothetical protein